MLRMCMHTCSCDYNKSVYFGEEGHALDVTKNFFTELAHCHEVSHLLIVLFSFFSINEHVQKNDSNSYSSNLFPIFI